MQQAHFLRVDEPAGLRKNSACFGEHEVAIGRCVEQLACLVLLVPAAVEGVGHTSVHDDGRIFAAVAVVVSVPPGRQRRSVVEREAHAIVAAAEVHPGDLVRSAGRARHCAHCDAPLACVVEPDEGTQQVHRGHFGT